MGGLAYMPLIGVNNLRIKLDSHVIDIAATTDIFGRLIDQGFTCDLLSSLAKIFFFERA